MERALTSISDANIAHSSSDEAGLKQLVEEYYKGDVVHSDDDSTDSEDDEVQRSSKAPGARRKGDDDGVLLSDQDAEEEESDQPTLAVASDKLDRVRHLLEDTIAEDPNVELQRAHEFNCGCVTFDGKPCIRQFTDEEIFDIRINMQGLNEAEKDLILLAIFHTSMNMSEMIHYKGKKRAEQKERKRTRNIYLVKSMRVCASTFRFLHVVSKNKVSAVQQWYREHGLTPRRKKSGGRIVSRKTLRYEDITRIFHFIQNFAQEHALVLPGRMAGYKRSDLRLLPSTYSKSSVWRDYYKGALQTTEFRAAALSTFRKLWNQLCPEIVCCRPKTDLCWECQKNNSLINRTVNCDEANKLATLKRQEGHLQHVKEEQDLYRRQVADAKLVVANGNMRLGRNTPCSKQCVMHYSFDFTQQLHYPSNPLQPGPIYFLTPRQCGIFGVCCEGVPQQVNYLIDEGMAPTKGSNACISYLHHFFETYGLGEESLSLHCDSCSGQNKNRYLIFYLIWRTIHGLHRNISLNFTVPGHTKFSPDWCFGLLKQKYRSTPVSCLEDLAHVTSQSTASGVNLAQLVGSESQEVYVPLYNWQSFLGEYFNPLVGIEKHHHFRISSDEPGVVYASKCPTDQGRHFNLLRTPDTYPPLDLPPQTPPPGLDARRQWYLYEKIREFCSDEGADRTCPRPSVPNPDYCAGIDELDAPPQKIQKREL